MPGIHNQTKIDLPFWGRVKVLFGASILLQISIATERHPGGVIEESSRILVGRFPKQRKNKDDRD